MYTNEYASKVTVTMIFQAFAQVAKSVQIAHHRVGAISRENGNVNWRSMIGNTKSTIFRSIFFIVDSYDSR